MMSRATGRAISEKEHIRQSLTEILTTPVGSRIMRREYGSLLADLIDQPQSQSLMLQVYSAVYLAVLRWEDRVNLIQVGASVSENGQVNIELQGEYVDSNEPLNLSIPISLGAA